jgi:hypothetical protein
MRRVPLVACVQDTSVMRAAKQSLALCPSGSTQKPPNANSKSEIHPVTIRDTSLPELCAGHVWR